ncbi:MAG TPA: hypothetical protein VFA20_24130 [Myxococcaceae bacterium]|nr:hypothetical protein [Myxococcaceae bacterium]
MKPRAYILLPALLSAALLLPRMAGAEDAGATVPPAAIPPKKMVTVLLKVLAMDQALQIRGEGDMVVIVPWEKGQEATRDTLMEIAHGVEKELTFRKRAIRFVPIQLKGAPAFKEAVEKEVATTILVPTGVSKAGLEVIAQVAKELKIHTLAMDASQVEDWLTVGLIPDENKMKVVLNANCVRAAGGYFEVALLKVAKIYHFAKEPQHTP